MLSIKQIRLSPLDSERAFALLQGNPFEPLLITNESQLKEHASNLQLSLSLFKEVDFSLQTIVLFKIHAPGFFPSPSIPTLTETEEEITIHCSYYPDEDEDLSWVECFVIGALPQEKRVVHGRGTHGVVDKLEQREDIGSE